MGVYIYDNNTEKELKNGYIGEYVEPRTPGANTIAYFPFTEDVLDHSGNGITLANTQYFTQDAIGYNRTHSQGIVYSYTGASFTNANVKFISMWYKLTTASGVTVLDGLDKRGSQYYTSHNDASISNKFVTFLDSDYNSVTSAGLTLNEWHHASIGWDDAAVKISKDGVQTTLYNGTPLDMGNTVYICAIGHSGNLNITVSDCICESVARTATDILKYYNSTKGNYGL